MVDSKGLRWIHAYLTTSDLAVYATISGSVEDFKDESNWAPDAIRALRYANLSSTSLSPSYLTSPELPSVHTLHESMHPCSMMV